MVHSKLFDRYTKVLYFFPDRFDEFRSKEYLDSLNKSQIMHQSHGNKVSFISRRMEKRMMCDAIVSNKPIFLGVKTADCLPILLYEKQKHFIAGIHAGWRGLQNGIVYNTIRLMRQYGCESLDIIAVIGPHIESCCYSGSRQFSLLFKSKYPGSLFQSQHQWHLDLSKIAIQQFNECGIVDQHIENINICTSCHSNYYSYRRDGRICGRMTHIIGMRSS